MNGNPDTAALPLCVDCDGTLIRTDLLHEAVMRLLKESWITMFLLPVWLLRGKAYVKQRIAERVTIDASTLPYCDEMLDIVRAARAMGRTTVLATASTRSQAEAIAAHTGLFDQVLATDGNVNLSGANKAARLEQLFGKRGFVYAGNSRADLAVWASCAGAIVVSRSAALRRAVEAQAPVFATVTPELATLGTVAKAIRVHQWLKNLLVFVPLLAAHQAADLATATSALLAFAAFSLCASAVYVINDLLDLPSDRRHVRKRARPFASGHISIRTGALIAPGLLACSVALCLLLPPTFTLVLAAYFTCTCIYSFWLKNQVVVDVMLLASLYTSRIIAGAAATSILPSFWLLAFSMFIFLSLAIVKRYSEMLAAQERSENKAMGRGYFVSDMAVLMSLGIAAGYNAILILALYVNSSDVGAMYANRIALWLILPPMLYWISRVWMKTHRGEMHDDPVVFAAKDKQSWAVMVMVSLAFWMATLR